MRENKIIRISVCPRCGQAYREHPALSRLDNETLICPDCGTREALDSIGVKPDEQEWYSSKNTAASMCISSSLANTNRCKIHSFYSE